MKNKFKTLLEKGQFDEAKAMIGDDSISAELAYGCLIETLEAQKRLLVDEIEKLKR